MLKNKQNKTLAQALISAKNAAKENVIKHSDLEPKQIRLLKNAGFLTSIIRGWYIFNTPGSTETSTVWYVGFWPFIKYYLLNRFGEQGYCLSAEASMNLHLEESQIARQVTVITKKASNQNIDLPYDTSLMLYAESKNFPEQVTKVKEINVMPLHLALCRLPSTYFSKYPLNIEIALRMLPSVSDISRILLDDALIKSAGRIAGALRGIKEIKKADQIIYDMKAAGYEIKEHDPFDQYQPVLQDISHIDSPYVGRIQAKWKQLRSDIIDTFPCPPGIISSNENIYIEGIKELYKEDAYNSLSIEGYTVTEELIQKVASGEWNPEADPKDLTQINAMAAKGYYNSFQVVIKSVQKVIKGDSPSQVFEDDLQAWYRELFSPSVQAGLLNASDLAGYRSSPVYIKGARHVPPGNKDAVIDSMKTLFDLLNEEEHPAVRAILGHYIFVYIHPYMDGNGRTGRFLMNLMLISGGYNWTIIRTEGRQEYMNALDEASTEENIKPFANFIKSELEYWELIKGGL